MGRHIGEDVQLGVPVSGRFLEREREATHPHGLPVVGIGMKLSIDRCGKRDGFEGLT